MNETPQKKPGKKRKVRSLSKSMQHLVLGVALIILVVASLLNARVSNTVFSHMSDVTSEQVLASIKAVTEIVGGFENYAAEVIRLWESIPSELRSNPQESRYRAYFDSYEEGGYAKELSTALEKLQNDSFYGDMYIAAVNRDTGTILYLLDPDNVLMSANHFVVGFWEQMTPDQVTALLVPETEEKDYGCYIEPAEDVGMLRVYGMRMIPDQGPWAILAMYDFPSVVTKAESFLIVISYVFILSLVILLIVLITRHRMKGRLVKPINAITSAAEQYIRKKKEGIAGPSECFRNLDIHTGDELEELGDVMAQMETDLGTYEQDLAAAAAEKAHIQTELGVATGIQVHMLPDSSTAFPDRTDFSIFATMDPAREVGGDFYDFFLVDKDHLGIVIADVSGKGIPAALFMMSSMIIINNLAMLGFSPKQTLEEANARICRHNDLNMFVSVWFGILDLKTGEVVAANAGHEYPAVGSPEKGFSLLQDRHGLVVGAMEGVCYWEYSFRLEKEGTLFIYTDGVAEATDAQDQLYGTDRLLVALNRAKDLAPREICLAVREDVDGFVKDAPQFDDITMLCLRWHGQE